MLAESTLRACAGLPSPVLTVYVNSSDTNASRHPRRKANIRWLLDKAAVVERTLLHPEAKACDRQVHRVVTFLENRHPGEKSLVIFAGAKTWQVIPLHVPVVNEMSWGAPQIESLLGITHSHRRYIAVVLNHKAARFFKLENGEFDLVSTNRFVINTSTWKHGEQGSVAAERAQKPRGPLRDRFQRRVDAQYQRLCHEVAHQATELAGKECLDGLFLIGPERLTQLVFDKIPRRLVTSTVRVPENFGRLSPKQLQKRLEPFVEAHEQERQLDAVRCLRGAEAGTLTNPDEVLAQLQNGAVRSLVVAQDLNLELRDCPTCKLASTAADPVCSDCGATKRAITLGALIARVWVHRSVAVEFVNGEAAELLRQIGGLGAWLTSTRAAAV